LTIPDGGHVRRRECENRCRSKALRRDAKRKRAWRWAAAGGRSMYRHGLGQSSRELILQGWRPPETCMDTGLQAKAHQSARRVRLPLISFSIQQRGLLSSFTFSQSLRAGNQHRFFLR
jgi:phage protein U